MPKPTNESVEKLFLNVDKIIFKDDGVYEDKALSDKILLTISHSDKIKVLQKLLEIDENNTGFYCMCLGTYAIELYCESKLAATIGFHHGQSIRYSKWHGDAKLAKIDDLLVFLAEQGLTKPLEEMTEHKKSLEEGRVAERKWLDIAPKCFGKYWLRIKSGSDEYFASLINDLNAEIPDKQKQIIDLLQIFGTTDNFWSAYPSYEDLPNELLKTFETKDIINAYLKSDRNYKTRRGLGRFLCSFEFKKTRKDNLKCINDEVINDLKKCFEWLGEKSGINEIINLQNDKINYSAGMM